MVRISENTIYVQLQSLPSQSELQAELRKCQIELQDILADRDAAGALVSQRRTAAVQELLDARTDLTLVYASIQEDIDRVGEEIVHLRRLVNGLSSSEEGESADSRQQDFCRVRSMIESAQAALTSLEQRQQEVISRISTLQSLLSHQAALENAFERHRMRRILVLEQTVKDILNKISLRKSLEDHARQEHDHANEQSAPDSQTVDRALRNHNQA